MLLRRIAMNHHHGHMLRMLLLVLSTVTISACAVGNDLYQTGTVAEFPTSLGQAAVLPLSDHQLEVRIPHNGGFVIDGRDVVDIQVFPLAPVADGEVVLIGTAYPGCSRDYYAITYGAWEADFYRLGDCERPMQIRFEPDASQPEAVVIKDQTGQLRYGVDQRQMVRLNAVMPTSPPVPTARPDPVEGTAIIDVPSTQEPAMNRRAAPSSNLPAARDFKLPPVGTLSIE
jgi:hypothetical protein